MKKLLLILSAIFVSVMAWAQTNDDTGLAYTLNPYAYDLSSSWDASTKKLTVRFTLNAVPNLNGDSQNSVTDGEPNGIQIYAVDPSGNRYRIGGPGRNVIQDAHVNKKGQYVLELDLSSGLTVGGTNPGQKIPDDVPLTWEVRVKGRSKRATTMTCTNAGWRPYHTHGVAVSKNKDSKHFGKIFVTENSDTKPANWSWLNTRVPGLLEYDPIKLTSTTQADQAVGHKGGTGLEPHRVRISEDGRIFVTSYPYTSYPSKTGTSTAVWELVDGTYRPIITCDANGTGRVVAMDVKGSGPNLKMLVCELIPHQGTYPSPNTQNRGQLRIREYNIGTSTTSRGIADASRVIYYNDYRTAAGYQGMIYQAYQGGWYMATEGMVNIAYGAGNAIWLKLGFNSNQVRQRIVYFDGTNNCLTYYDTGGNTSSTGMRATQLTDTYVTGMLGGDGFLIQGDTLITAGIDKVYLFKIGSAGTLSSLTSVSTISGTFHATNNWVNDFAIDPAHNLYAVSASARNLMVVSLPYSGSVTTPAPAGNTFVLADPIPNILATDLRFAPDGNSDRYVFSFNVNTTPQVAQIRFYKSYGDNGENDMKKNLAKINADDYPGEDSITPSFVYDIPTNQLKQGKISVSLGMCGGTIEDGKINNGKLPRGEWYWSVYVEAPRKSSVFAPIYRLVGQTHATEGYERKHATVNNYPETDGFGNIIVAHNPQNTTNDATRPEKGLRIYGISDSGNDEHAYTNTDRYSLRATYLNKNATTGMLNYPRRMDVASDGKVYIADEGSPTDDKNWKDVANGPVIHVRGGVKVWDPATPKNFTLFSDNKIFTATSVALWNGKLYATNTYDEYVKHLNGKTNYTKDQQANTSQYGWNGFVQYDKVDEFYTTSNDGTWDNFWSKNSRAQERALGRGDAAGNIALVAMDKGVWMCQHKEHNRAVKDATYQPLADNLDGYILSFVPYGSNTRTWRSCIENGVDNYDTPGSRKERADASDFSQKLNSPVQSTPGGGIAYKKVNGKEYLYVVNHDGNIAQLEITSWSGSGTTAKPTIPIENIKILTTPAETKGTKEASAGGYSTTWTGAYITSMTFDYAGNLVTTTGKNYHDGPQDIVVYTMPYDRVNAREIQAPNSCRYIPERVSHLNMGDGELSNIILENQGNTCHVDIYRPMFNTSFSTICLPFDVDLSEASANEYKDAKLMRFAEAVITEVNNEKMLELQFTEITNGQLEAGIPYLIQPQEPITQIVHLAQQVSFKSITPEDQEVNFTDEDQNNSITFKGIIPYQQIEVANKPWPLIVVDNNRLAEVSTTGYINGFRAYFQLAEELEPGTKAAISMRKPTPTNVITIDGKRVNIEKFLREGRVYIRVGDSLYTISGEKVE